MVTRNTLRTLFRIVILDLTPATIIRAPYYPTFASQFPRSNFKVTHLQVTQNDLIDIGLA